ncbi:MAG: DUF2480 family protein, partial [Flavobacteriaceae bacterium]|nr:DUF2480 family protein [Flavobacteriaceae bacterium]
MSNEITNRVANSKLVTIDLEDFYPSGERLVFDIKKWLYQGLILKENDFRAAVKNHNWEAYQNTFVALTCSVEAIIPSWAYLLITVSLTPFAKKIIVGDLEQLESAIYQDIIHNMPVENYSDKPVIIKG